ncbi:hypothetical protein CAPTEDRAFT_98465, partial [Capitella teleta]
RRTISRKQRSAANQRERRRMVSLNTAFDQLRTRIPTFPHEKKLSRIQTLKYATEYIAVMAELLKDHPKSDDCRSETESEGVSHGNQSENNDWRQKRN